MPRGRRTDRGGFTGESSHGQLRLYNGDTGNGAQPQPRDRAVPGPARSDGPLRNRHTRRRRGDPHPGRLPRRPPPREPGPRLRPAPPRGPPLQCPRLRPDREEDRRPDLRPGPAAADRRGRPAAARRGARPARARRAVRPVRRAGHHGGQGLRRRRPRRRRRHRHTVRTPLRRRCLAQLRALRRRHRAGRREGHRPRRGSSREVPGRRTRRDVHRPVRPPEPVVHHRHPAHRRTPVDPAAGGLREARASEEARSAPVRLGRVPSSPPPLSPSPPPSSSTRPGRARRSLPPPPTCPPGWSGSRRG